jgi:hypothetical protein
LTALSIRFSTSGLSLSASAAQAVLLIVRSTAPKVNPQRTHDGEAPMLVNSNFLVGDNAIVRAHIRATLPFGEPT